MFRDSYEFRSSYAPGPYVEITGISSLCSRRPRPFILNEGDSLSGLISYTPGPGATVLFIKSARLAVPNLSISYTAVAVLERVRGLYSPGPGDEFLDTSVSLLDFPILNPCIFS